MATKLSKRTWARRTCQVLAPYFCCVACGSSTNNAPEPEADTTGTTIAAPELELVIDDFEDGDQKNELGGNWYTYDDVPNGGLSTAAFPPGSSGAAFSGEGYASDHSLLAEFTFDKGTLTYDPYIGIGAAVGSEADPLDLSDYPALSYHYRGAGHSVRFETSDVTDYDYHAVQVPASSSWKTVELPLALFVQEGWGTSVPFDPTKVIRVAFHIRGASGESGSFEVDDLGMSSPSEEQEPDLELRDPAPPEPTELESVVVDNPLQALALSSLDRGYNITNWLEEARFESFGEYDESFVASLREAGFRSLRLPIDLDLYVEETSGSEGELELTLHDDLFTILDSFEAWTADNDMSFTIDYHQYDRSLDFSDAESMDLAVALWGRVAEHFADNSREDLFFELLNEPELSTVDGDAPTQQEWTDLAERMVAAIRDADSSHTIIFGDIEWYGIGPLSRREPLSDDNVIYAFHFYEPFIFTHQGASWANMATTHDIPFPYTPDRWSEYSSELGFTPFMESWILTQVRTYYRNGTPEALRNLIVPAKQWAVEHQVPVICNEFGVYDATSRLEDRARYYEELIGVFSEFEIPWQHWFMIMDEDGAVIPEYREAFGLE